VNTNFNLYFDPIEHKYTDDWGIPFISQTQIAELYSQKKNWLDVARNCAAIGNNPLCANPTHPKHDKYLKYKGKSAEDLLISWKVLKEEACEKGSEKHDYIEQSIKNATNFQSASGTGATKRVKLFTVKDVIDDRNKELFVDKSKLIFLKARFPEIYAAIMDYVEDGWKPYSEVGVFNLTYRVAGLIDLLLYKHPYFMIIDWKTNRAPMRFESGYFDKDANGELTDTFISTADFFLPPLEYLPASTGNKYAIQLSGYTFQTEQFGIIPTTNNYLYHIREIKQKLEGDIVVKVGGADLVTEVLDTHKMPYLRKEIVNMFTDYRIKTINNNVSDTISIKANFK
jgi:hypothetical protein